MRLAIAVLLSAGIATLPSCDRQLELFPEKCACDIDSIVLSQPATVTYRVETYDGAAVSSVTFRTDSGLATVEHPSLPFEVSRTLSAGTAVQLAATGRPGEGTIVLTYEVDHRSDTQPSASILSRAWVQRDGTCQ